MGDVKRFWKGRNSTGRLDKNSVSSRINRSIKHSFITLLPQKVTFCQSKATIGQCFGNSREKNQNIGQWLKNIG
jgi:hypothetical protein